jgi:signal transduction histidine kinase
MDAHGELRASLDGVLRDAFPDLRVAMGASFAELQQGLGEEPPALLLVDADAGGRRAASVLHELRRHALTSCVFLVAAVADCPTADLAALLDAGADDLLLKPVREEELLARVTVALGRRRSLGALAERAARLEELYGRQTEFLSVVSHEIRTPLSAIVSAANILVRYGAQRPESVDRFGRVIQDEGRRLTRLINNLLDLTKIEADQMDWRSEEIGVDELVEGVRESFAALGGERRVEIVVEATSPAATLVGDRDKLTQVLSNLVSNAVKYGPEGSRVTVRHRALPGGGVRIEVEDQGPGIPAGAEDRIFQRFQQLDVDDSKRGTGLGLTISRHIIERHGGVIWAEPNHAGGALLVVELPQRRGESKAHGSVR